MTAGSASKSPRSGGSTGAWAAALAAGAIIGAVLPALAGMLTRTLVDLAGEALLVVATLMWLSGAGARRGEAAPPVPAADAPVPARNRRTDPDPASKRGRAICAEEPRQMRAGELADSSNEGGLRT
jgi:hypothetical protein